MSEDISLLSLPLEILLKISTYLNYRSLCGLVLVSLSWRDVWENPLFWWRFKLRPRHCWRETDLETILNTKRFSAMRTLTLSFLDLNDLAVISKKRNMKSLEIGCVHQILDQEDFAFELLSWESVSLFDGYDDDGTGDPPITNGQMEAFFQSFTDKSKMKCLTIKGYDLRKIDIDAFAKCSKLEKIKLDMCELNSAQMTALLEQCAQRTNLKELNLGFWFNFRQLERVDPKTFALGVTNIDKVTLNSNRKTYPHMEELLKTIGKETKMKDLTVPGGYLTGVDPDILAIGVNQLERVDIAYTHLGKEQIEKIFQQIMIKTNLKRLDIRGNLDLKYVHNHQKLLEDAKKKIDILIHDID